MDYLEFSRNKGPIFFCIGAILLIVYVIFFEIKLSVFDEYNGVVIEKQQIPPKKMPELLISHNTTTFPVGKWMGIDFDNVQVGDSIVKRRYEAHAFYYKKKKDGTFEKYILTYWLF